VSLSANACRLVDRAVVDCADIGHVRLEGVAPEPLGAEAARIVGRADWRLAALGPVTRTGLRSATLMDGRERTLQVELVEAGLARAWPGDDEALYADLLVAEDAAATARRGEWGESGRFRHVAAVPPPSLEGFAVIRGRVLSTGTTRRHAYLNFGERYRSDFTIRLRRADARRWGWWDDLQRFVGHRVEARGFAFEDGGPMMELDAPSQLRFID
jgi:hypothetical protein